MPAFEFARLLKAEIEARLFTKDREWSIKGFIDASKKIYPLSLDTKLLSKVLELTVIPLVQAFAEKHKLRMYLAEHQLQYPDVALEGTPTGNKKYALDIKTTYREGDGVKRGFTLGSFRGSLREPLSTRYSRFPYGEYAKHWILGIIYTRKQGSEEAKLYSVRDLHKIESVIRDLEVILQEKYKIANSVPGSGNTANIGSIANIEMLRNGTGPFAKHGEEVFLDYWTNYLRREDAERKGVKRPYGNLQEYFDWKKKRKRK